MKKIVFLLMVSMATMKVAGQQTPWNGWEGPLAFTNGYFHDYSPYEFYAPLQTQGPVFLSQQSHFDIAAGQRIHLQSGFRAGDFLNGYFHARIGVAPDFDVVFIEPNSHYPTVEEYEKLELGMRFPQPVEDAIQAFVENNATAQTVNPFDPNEIDVRAQFTFLGQYNGPYPSSIESYGFYYWDYQRDITAANSADWHLNSVPTDWHFRVRFAPYITGKWKCSITANVPGFGTYTVNDIVFQCSPPANPDNKGFIHNDPLSPRFKIGSKTFFPIGQNMPGPADIIPNEEAPEQSYVSYEEDIQQMAASGANSFRVLLSPWQYEIEFEHLNNYTARMDNAWEFDHLLQVARDNNIYVDLNMQIYYALDIHGSFDITWWDWTSNHCNNPTDTGYCYHTELGLTNPEEFLTDAQAMVNYKKRLRYIIARWGYSRNIMLLELFSEVNNIGEDFNIVGPNCEVGSRIRYPYSTPNGRTATYNWQYEMSRYIKQDLSHFQHLLTCNYAGPPSSPDNSLDIPFFDVADYDRYTDYLNRTETYHLDQAVYDAHLKSVFFSETGGPGMDICSDYTEWKRVFWSIPFTGLAGGFNWSGGASRQHWDQFSHLRDFIGDLDLNPSQWTSDYDKSASLLVESVYLKHSTVGENPFDKAIGVVMNRMYNAYSMRTCNNCKCADDWPINSALPSDAYPNTSLMSPPQDLSWQSNKIRLTHLGVVQHYHVEWYDALAGVWLASDDKYTDGLGRLELEYPTLYLTNNQFRPIIGFKVYRFNDSFRHPYNFAEVDSIPAGITIYPNPASDFIIISSPINEYGAEVKIYTMSMNVVYTKTTNSPETEIPVTFLSPGIYYVEIVNINGIFRERIIILHK